MVFTVHLRPSTFHTDNYKHLWSYRLTNSSHMLSTPPCSQHHTEYPELHCTLQLSECTKRMPWVFGQKMKLLAWNKVFTLMGTTAGEGKTYHWQTHQFSGSHVWASLFWWHGISASLHQSLCPVTSQKLPELAVDFRLIQMWCDP